MGIAAHDAAHHHQDTQGVCLLDELPQRFGPSRRLTPLFHVEPKGVP